MTGRLILSLLLIVFLSASAHAQVTVPVVVKLGPLANLNGIVSLLGGTLIDSIPNTNTHLIRVPSLPVLTPVLQLLGVQWLEPNRGLSLPGIVPEALLGTPTNWGADWYKHQPAMYVMRSAQASYYATGRGVVVADINSITDYSHPALIGHLTAGYDFVTSKKSGTWDLDDQSTAGFLDDQSTAGFLDDQSTAGFLDDQSTAGFLDDWGITILNDQSVAGFLDGKNGAYSHGTLTVGVIAAVAPDAMIMPLRAFDDNGNADTFTLAKAIRHATRNGADVLNMSFGTLSDVKVLREAIDHARQSGVVLVASAGNNNTSVRQYPAAYSGVLATGATDIFDRKTWFSNYGPNVVVNAPGDWIVSSYPGGKYVAVSGTSFSAPAVAGAAALLRDRGRSASRLKDTAVDIDGRNPAYDGKLGYGRIDVLNAVR